MQPPSRIRADLTFEMWCSFKVKIFDFHLVKPWIAFVTQNNVFLLWDYEQKTCLKSFSTSHLESKDGTKQANVSRIKYVDREKLRWSLPSIDLMEQKELDSFTDFRHNWLVFLGESKIYFYDYFTDQTDVINPSLIENRTPKCLEMVDTRYVAIGCTEGMIFIFDLMTWTIVKRLKGYHIKPIIFMAAYKQNQVNRPRLLVASADDLLACWNVDTDGPAFKFFMNKKGKLVNDHQHHANPPNSYQLRIMEKK